MHVPSAIVHHSYPIFLLQFSCYKLPATSYVCNASVHARILSLWCHDWPVVHTRTHSTKFLMAVRLSACTRLAAASEPRRLDCRQRSLLHKGSQTPRRTMSSAPAIKKGQEQFVDDTGKYEALRGVKVVALRCCLALLSRCVLILHSTCNLYCRRGLCPNKRRWM